MAKWLLFPATSSFNNGANWDTGVVPTDVATFGATFGSTTIGIDAPITLGSFHFLSDSPFYTFNVNADMTIHGSGFVYEGDGSAPAYLAIATGTTVTVDSDGDANLALVQGTGNLFKQGAGVLTLSGGVSGPGSVTVAAGTLSGPITGNIVNDAIVILRGDQFGGVTFVGNLTGNGTIVVQEGTRVRPSQGSLDSFQGSVIVDGTLSLSTITDIASSFEVAGTLDLKRGGVSGNITGPGSVVVDVGGDFINLTGHNTYTGGTFLGSAASDNVPYIIGTTDSLQGQIVSRVDFEWGRPTVSFSQSFDGVFTGAISGNVGVSVFGPGTVTLTGHNTYTGETYLGGGTLKLGAADSLPAGSVLSISGGTFDIGNLNLTQHVFLSTGSIRLGGGTFTYGFAVATGFGVIEAQTTGGPSVVTATGGVLRFNGNAPFDTAKIGGAAGTVLRLDGTVGSSVSHPVIDFEGGRGLLDLSPMSLANFHGLITDFASGEGIKVADARSISLDATGHLLTVFNASHASLGTLIFSQSYSGDGFLVSEKVISVSDSHSLDYSRAAGGVYTDLAAQFTEHAPAGQGWSGGPSSVTPVSTDTFINMVNVTGSAFDDLLVGGTQSGSLLGGAGNDLIYGNTAQATADNASVLTLGGGAGSNALYGSSGFNTFLSGDADGGFNQIWGAASKMDGVSGFANNTLSFENVAAGRSVYVDLLNGHNAYVNSGPQNNGTYTLEDSIANVPNVIGSSGGDVIIADNGPARLTGAVGADQLYGGTGADTFAYMAYGDSNLVAGYDAIYGFQSGTDKIDLSALNSDASHLLIQTAGTSNSVYLEQTPGSFNPNTDLAIVINTAAPGGVHASDFIF